MPCSHRTCSPEVDQKKFAAQIFRRRFVKETCAEGKTVNSRAPAIRYLHADEWRLLKTLRLRALGTDPQSYWETVDDALAYDDAYWATFAEKLTRPASSRMFILECSGSIRGFVYGIKKEGSAYRVGGLWIDPAHREKGMVACSFSRSSRG